MDLLRGGSGAGGGEEAQYLEVTQAERDAIERLCGMVRF